MKKETATNVVASATSNENTETSKASNNGMNRRKFVELTASAAMAFTIVPRHVLGKGYVPPSDKITLAYIGVGTQGIRELLPLLAVPEIQVIAVCDPNKEAIGYRDWGTTYLRDEIRKTIHNPDWTPGGDKVIPGGRDTGKDIVDSYYANVRADQKFKGCTAYADARELLDKEKDLDAVKIMTPDHLHGVLAMAAMKEENMYLCINRFPTVCWKAKR